MTDDQQMTARKDQGVSWYAPLGQVPEGATRYRPLPLLEQCRKCKTPLTAFEVYTIVDMHGQVRRGLCSGCALGRTHGQRKHRRDIRRWWLKREARRV